MADEKAEAVLEEPKEKKEEAKPSKKKAIASMVIIIEEELPDIPGRRKKIHHLWDNHFRVNYWDMEEGTIEPTHFVTVNEDGSCKLE